MTMPVDSNRYQLFYCRPPVVIPPHLQRPVPRQQSFNHELQSAVCSSSSSSSSLSSSTTTHNRVQPILQHYHQHQPHHNLPPPLLPIKLSSTSPPEYIITSSSQSSSSSPSPTSSPSCGAFKTSDKTIKISITRKKLKVTHGNGRGEGPLDLVTSILQPCKETTGVPGKMKRARVRAPVESTSNARTLHASLPPPALRKLPIPTPPPPPAPSPSPAPAPTSTPTPTATATATLTENHFAPPIKVPPSTLILPTMMVDLKVIPEKCSYCDSYFRTYEAIKHHLLTQHYSTIIKGVITCPHCETVHRDYDDFADHCLQNHSTHSYKSFQEHKPFDLSTGSSVRKCSICNINFDDAKSIRDHYIMHKGYCIAFRCRFCNKLLASLQVLVLHLQTTHFISLDHKQQQQQPVQVPVSAPILTPSTPQQQLLSSTSFHTSANGSYHNSFMHH